MALKVLSKNNITCYNHDDGLYFFGERGFTPEGELLCSVKIGVASDLAKRIATYKTHSCQLFHQENHILTEKPSFCQNWGQAEEYAQDIIKTFLAIGQPPYSWEWYYVSEPVYFELCKDPWQIFIPNKIKELQALANETKNYNRFFIEKEKYDVLYKEYEEVKNQLVIDKGQKEEIQNLKEMIKACKELIKAYENGHEVEHEHCLYSIKFNSAPLWKRLLMAMRII